MEWRQVKGYEGIYEISENGEVKSVSRKVPNKGTEMTVAEKILKPMVDDWGYKKVTLHKDGKPNQKFVHRLLAEVFVPPYCGEQVNHIDGDKSNNSISNLEWCTGSENMAHAYKCGLHEKAVPVRIVELGMEFPSISETARFINGKVSGIWRCLSGRNKTHRGYHFEEVKEDA